MLWTIIVVLFVLWLVGAFGSNVHARIPKTGNAVHTLLVIVLILVVLNLVGVI
ncbi:MAG: lmo0937 family membrane protein [Nitrospirales bacterium]